MYKKYKVVRLPSGEILEEFTTLSSAEQLVIMLQKKGESVQVLTEKEDVLDKENPGFTIEGLEIEEPNNDFGSEMDMYDDDATDFEIED